MNNNRYYITDKLIMDMEKIGIAQLGKSHDGKRPYVYIYTADAEEGSWSFTGQDALVFWDAYTKFVEAANMKLACKDIALDFANTATPPPTEDKLWHTDP